ncbi:MAG TPA: hypothetical protein VFM63_13105, partial [Pyrinomonadaceae bacterium]|nr:hypothetical protein [Pyrinomonadaceae bacterium]
MIKRLMIVLSLVALFVIMAEPRHSTNSMLMTDAEIAALDAAEADAVEDNMKTENKGNVFVRAIKAPFKAVGRLFGCCKKKDDNQFHRLTEKDVKQFKSAPSTRLIGVTEAKSGRETAAVVDGDAKSF